MPEIENQPRLSSTIQRGLTRTEYECLGTGKIVDRSEIGRSTESNEESS